MVRQYGPILAWSISDAPTFAPQSTTGRPVFSSQQFRGPVGTGRCCRKHAPQPTSVTEGFARCHTVRSPICRERVAACIHRQHAHCCSMTSRQHAHYCLYDIEIPTHQYHQPLQELLNSVCPEVAAQKDIYPTAEYAETMAHTRRSEEDSDAQVVADHSALTRLFVDLRPSVSLRNRRREIMI
jgi:hypothetical protein